MQVTPDTHDAVSDRAATTVELLDRSLFFGALPEDARTEIASDAQRINVAAGHAIVREGERGDSYYLIAAGSVEVWSSKAVVPSERVTPITAWVPEPTRDTLVGRLGPGDGFGETALLLTRPRGATVVATVPTVVDRIDGARFLSAIARNRGLAVSLEDEMLLRATATSLGKTSPFAGLPPDALRWLAPRVRQVTAAAGQDIVVAGSEGDALYVIRSGRVSVHKVVAGEEREVDTMGPGDAFGEQAILTGETRSATIRALEPTELLRLGREDFAQVLREYRERESYFIDLLFRRQHPRRIAEWRMEPQRAPDGTTSYMLEDPARHRYLRLSEEAAFVWEQMDGTRNVRDLTLAYASRFGVFAVQAIVDTMLQLHAGGFVEIQSLPETDAEQPSRPTVAQRVTSLIGAVMRYVRGSVALADSDALFTWLYRHGGRWLFPWPVQLVILALAVAGAAEFVRLVFSGGVGAAPVAASALVFFLGLVIHAIGHESAHALTCKRFGRAVHRAGFGWYLFVPSVFVDTSDVWMAGRGARIAVTIAGPYTNFVFAGIATLLIAPAAPAVQAILFGFAATGYVLGVTNLNPLVEFDGYYVLTDWLDIPNLRAKALGFIGTLLWHVPRPRLDRHTARVFLGYGALSLAYTGFILYSVATGYQEFLTGIVSRVLPERGAEVVGWALTLLVGYLVVQQAWAALRGGVAAARQRTGRAA